MATRVPTNHVKLALVILALLLGCQCAASQDCGSQSDNPSCPDNQCCSIDGYCGTTSAFCGVGCQSKCSPPGPPTAGASMKRLAYFSNSAYTYASPYTFLPENLTGQYYTHALYAFAAIDPKTFQLVPTDAADLGPDPVKHPEKGLYFRFNRRAHALGMKTLISIGGSDQGVNASFSKMASSPVNLTAFVRSAVAFAQKYGFDGLDLDWELPNNPSDRTNFVTLIKALRAKISTLQTPLLLTAAVAADNSDIEASYSVPDLNQYLDWVSVMAYNIHGSWEPVTGLHTALSDPSDPSQSIEGVVQTWLSLGMSPAKVVLGLAAYGHEWQLADAANNTVGADAVQGANQGGPISQQDDGAWAYFEIADIFLKGGATQIFDVTGASMYAYKGNMWIGYDNPKSIGIKAKWAQQNGLGGYMFWSMDMDFGYALANAAMRATK